MSNVKGNALIIMSLIIGASGLGTGIFSVLRFQVLEGPQGEPGINGTDGIDGINGTLNNVVGVWETIYGGLSIDYDLILSGIQVNESEYFTLTEGGISLQLTRPGWYRFNIQILWVSLLDMYTYAFYIEKNTTVIHTLEWIWGLSTHSYIVNRFVYVYSDGDDVFRFNCQQPSADDTFGVSSNQEFNQIVVEYVKEA